MKRRIYPIPALGSLCLGLTGAAGCSSDPIAGEWQVVEMEGMEMPYVYEYEDYGAVSTYGASLLIFDDLLGQFSMYYSVEMDYSYTYAGSDVQRTTSEGYSYSTRVWVRPSEAASRYQLFIIGGDDVLDCELTSGDTVLACEFEDEPDEPTVFNRLD